MITELSGLTMRQYVDLLCGETSVLLKPHEVASPQQIESVRKRLAYDFARLSDSAGTRSLLSDAEGRKRADAELVLFQVLNNLIVLGAHEDVRKVLKIYGIAREMTDQQTAAEVDRLLKKAQTEIKRHQQEQGEKPKARTASEIRLHFDRQAASLMSYFKFQINMDVMPASQFACLIDQAQKEIRAKMAAYKK